MVSDDPMDDFAALTEGLRGSDELCGMRQCIGMKKGGTTGDRQGILGQTFPSNLWPADIVGGGKWESDAVAYGIPMSFDFARILPSDENGASLCMSNMGIRPRAATAIALDLRHNTTISSLDISRNVLGDAGATAVAAALQTNTTLETLEIWSNGVSCNGVGCIGAALMRNSTLKVLELSFNGMGDEGATLFSRVIPHNKGVQHLGLGFNGIMAGGAQSIAETLKYNDTLVSLELSYNQVEDKGAMHLAEALAGGVSVHTLGLSSNGIGDNGANSLAEALESPDCNLVALSLASNNITDVGATRLARALTVNTCLKALYLEENPLGDAGLAAIMAAQGTVSMKELDEELKLALAMSQSNRLGRNTGLFSVGIDVLRMVVGMCQVTEPRHVVFYAKSAIPAGVEGDLNA